MKDSPASSLRRTWLPLAVALASCASATLAQEATEPLDLERFVGTYERHLGSGRTVAMSLRNEQLFAQSAGGGGGALEHTDGNSFRFTIAPQFVHFEVDEDGNVTGFALERGQQKVQYFASSFLDRQYQAQAGVVRPHAVSDAVLAGDTESLRELIAGGADVSELDTRRHAGRNGRRPLNWAALRDDPSSIQALLEAGAEIDGTNRSGFTALHHAAESGGVEAARALIDAGADTTLRTASGHQPVDIALANERREVAQLLQESSNEGAPCTEEECRELASTSPEAFEGGLETASLLSVSARVEPIARLLKGIESGLYGTIDSLLIVKDGKLVFERYFGSWAVDKPHQMQSVSKSITSLLIGSAIEQGHIDSVDDPIGKYLPKYRNLLVDGREAITIADLLTMSAGFEWDEASAGYLDQENVRLREVRSDDSVKFTLELPFINEPGDVFTYAGGYVTLAGAIIKNATGAPSVLDYIEQSTLSHLGFEKLGWLKQMDGRTNTAGGVLLRPRDLARIGHTMLNGGVYRGERVVSETWVDSSLAPKIQTGTPWADYGYYWWGRSVGTDAAEYDIDAALGWGGQELLLVRDLDLAVVVTATNFQRASPTIAMLTLSILPAFEAAAD